MTRDTRWIGLGGMLFICYCAPGALRAQTQGATPVIKEGQVAAASMEQIVSFVTLTAFRGIAINDEQRAKARTIIVEATRDQQRLDTSRSDFIDRRQVIVDRRRLALRALISNELDLKRFDRNAIELEP